MCSVCGCGDSTSHTHVDEHGNVIGVVAVQSYSGNVRYSEADTAVLSYVSAQVAQAIVAIRALIAGERRDLLEIRLDMAGLGAFERAVYQVTRAIPPGETLTYGEIAVRLGDKLLARDVGVALGQNPWPIVVPCHRVTAAGGKLGGFSARGGARTKLKLLSIEGAPAAAQASLQSDEYFVSSKDISVFPPDHGDSSFRYLPEGSSIRFDRSLLLSAAQGEEAWVQGQHAPPEKIF